MNTGASFWRRVEAGRNQETREGCWEARGGRQETRRGRRETKAGRREASYKQQNQGGTISEAPSWRLEASDAYREATDKKDRLEDYQEK